MAAQFGADLWKWHWANKGSCISVLKTVPQCRSTQQWPSLWLSHKLANKTNLIKSIPLSLSPSPPTSLSPPHPPPHPLDIPPHKHALKVPITFVRNNNKLFFPTRQLCKWSLEMPGRKLQDYSQLHNNFPDKVQRLCGGALLRSRLRRTWRMCSLFTAMRRYFSKRDKEMRNCAWSFMHRTETNWHFGKK